MKTDASLMGVEETLRPYVFIAMRSYAVVVLEDLVAQMHQIGREHHSEAVYEPFMAVLQARIDLERKMARIDGGVSDGGDPYQP